MQAVPFSLLVAKSASPTQALISPAFSINSASVPKVMLLFSVQMSGEWYKGRHFAWVHGVINMIQNGICRRAKG